MILIKKLGYLKDIDNLLFTILVLSLIAGQLVKIPIIEKNGLTILDFTTIVFTTKLFLSSKFKFSKPPLFIIIATIFALIGIISVVLSPMNLTLNEKLISISYALRFLLYISFGYFLINANIKNLTQKIINTFLVAGTCTAVLGLLQLIFIPNLLFLRTEGWDPHYFRTVSTFLDPNFAGAFFVLTLLSIYLNYKKRSKLNLILFGIVFTALLTTYSRGSYLFFTVSFITTSLLLKSWKSLLLSLILSLALFLGFQSYTTIIAIPKNIDRSESAQFRLFSWQMGWELFQKSPILGVGFNSYRFALGHYNLAPKEFIQSRGGSSNDSSLLHVLATTGIIGFVAYLLFIFSILKKSLNLSFIKNRILIFAGVIGLLAQSFFSNTLFYPWFLMWIILGAVQLEES